MDFSQALRNRLFFAVAWVFILTLLGIAEASELDNNLGPGLYYVEMPGTINVGRLEDSLFGQQTGRICRIGPDGRLRREIFVFKDFDETPDSIAVDEATRRIYFTSGKKQGNSSYLGKIQRINTDGTDLKTIISTDTLPFSLNLVQHPNQKMLYWVEGKDGNLIKRYNVNNRTGIETIVDTQKYPCSVNTTDCPPIQDIAVDTKNMDIYWTQSRRWTRIPGSIHRLSLSMKPGETSVNRTGVQILLRKENYPHKMQYVRGTIYWVDQMDAYKGYNLKRLSVDGWGEKDPEILLRTPVEEEAQIISDFTVDIDRGTIWAFIGYTFSNLYRANVTGGEFTLLRRAMARSKSLVHVSWFQNRHRG
jgi:hypothetical protein